MQDLDAPLCYAKLERNTQFLLCFMLLYLSKCTRTKFESKCFMRACGSKAISVCRLGWRYYDRYTTVSLLQIGMFILLVRC